MNHADFQEAAEAWCKMMRLSSKRNAPKLAEQFAYMYQLGRNDERSLTAEVHPSMSPKP